MSGSDIDHQPSVGMPESMIEEIESRLGYGDSKAEWIREACRQRLQRERDDEQQISQ